MALSASWRGSPADGYRCWRLGRALRVWSDGSPTAPWCYAVCTANGARIAGGTGYASPIKAMTAAVHAAERRSARPACEAPAGRRRTEAPLPVTGGRNLTPALRT